MEQTWINPKGILNATNKALNILLKWHVNKFLNLDKFQGTNVSLKILD